MAATLRPRVLSSLTATLSLLVGFIGCSSSASTSAPTKLAKSTAPAAPVVAQPPLPPPAPIFPVMLGIDVLESDGFAAVKGKRIGLLTHAAGVNRRGESTIDILRHAPGVKLVALFAPEHGLYGTEEAGKNLPDTIDRRTGLPVHSLHGKTRKPTREMLKGLDALVIDLQDIGVRSYTFVSAMRYALEGCFRKQRRSRGPRPSESPRRAEGGRTVDGRRPGELCRGVPRALYPRTDDRRTRPHGRRGCQACCPCPNGAPARSSHHRAHARLAALHALARHRPGLRRRPRPSCRITRPCVGYAMTGLGCEIGGFSHGTGRTRIRLRHRLQRPDERAAAEGTGRRSSCPASPSPR
jgi:hypothetical protein